jgi:hypothetical protein
MGVSPLKIRVARPGDVQTVVRFFERTVYGIRRVGDDTLLLTPPGNRGHTAARREVEIYLRMLERRHPGVDVSVAL